MSAPALWDLCLDETGDGLTEFSNILTSFLTLGVAADPDGPVGPGSDDVPRGGPPSTVVVEEA